MKTNLPRFIAVLAVLTGLATVSPARAERTIGWNLLGGDTFKLGTVDAAEHWDAVDSEDDFVSPYSVTQIRGVGSALVGSLPEQRDNDFVFTPAEVTAMNATNVRKWQGSSSGAGSIVLDNGGSGTNGYARLSNQTTGNRGVAYVEMLEHPTLGGTFKVEGDMRSTGAGSVVGIGMLDTLTPDGTLAFGAADDISPIWMRLEEITTSAASPLDIYGKRYVDQEVAQICLMSGSDMIRRIYIPLASNPVESVPAEVIAFNYDTVGFNRIWMEWFDDNTVDVKINNESVDLLTGFDLTSNGVDLDDDEILAMGFQLQGGGELGRFAATPEPSSMVMMCFGMLFFGWNNRRQRRRARKVGNLGFGLTG